MKTFMFVSSSGCAWDDNSVEQENCQYLAIGKGNTIQEAWEDCKDKITGFYDKVSAYELVSDKEIYGDFELNNLVNIPAECEDIECDYCPNSYKDKKELDCPYI